MMMMMMSLGFTDKRRENGVGVVRGEVSKLVARLDGRRARVAPDGCEDVPVQRFRGGLVFKAHRLRVSLNSRLESNKEEEG